MLSAKEKMMMKTLSLPRKSSQWSGVNVRELHLIQDLGSRQKKSYTVKKLTLENLLNCPSSTEAWIHVQNSAQKWWINL